MSVIAPIHALSIQPICTSCIMSVIAPIHALPSPSVHPYDKQHQEFPDGFASYNYGVKTHLKLQ